MKIKPLHLVGLVLIVGFAIFGATGLKGAMTPYVDIAQAKSTTDRVQVKGKLDKSSVHTDSLGRLLFRLSDFKTHDSFAVCYTGPEHANMEMARDVVAMGHWDPSANQFKADEMNIKCPDKYQTGSSTPNAS